MNDQIAVFIDFENIALWAEREFFDFEVTALMEYLQTRGPAVVKRAYGDWSRFSRYRDELMNNSFDLIQIYSVRGGKNRADIRMAIDSFEIAMTRPQINTYVIVSGDSDFGPLVGKLREYGRYTLGIGPRSITHHLLVKSCDEFIYLETALGETADVEEQSSVEREQARSLLMKALQAHGQRGELPVLATRLKQTMLLMDPAFNEANFGYVQFKAWLEDHNDLVRLYVKDLQLFVAPEDFIAPGDLELLPATEVSAVQVPETQTLLWMCFIVRYSIALKWPPSTWLPGGMCCEISTGSCAKSLVCRPRMSCSRIYANDMKPRGCYAVRACCGKFCKWRIANKPSITATSRFHSIRPSGLRMGSTARLISCVGPNLILFMRSYAPVWKSTSPSWLIFCSTIATR